MGPIKRVGPVLTDPVEDQSFYRSNHKVPVSPKVEDPMALKMDGALRAETQVDSDANDAAISLNFGTAEALNEVRNLTDAAAMTRLLHECIAYQRSLDLRLDNLFSQRIDLDKQVTDVQKSAQVLDIVKADADYMRTKLQSTTNIAHQISGEVRRLDLAQSRVKDTLSLIDAVLERGTCIDGVRKALASQDFESAAKYVQTFLEIDDKYKNSGSDQRDQLLEYKKQLEGVVKKGMYTAVDERDNTNVLRFVALCSPLQMEEEGLKQFVGYLRKTITIRSRVEFEQLVELIAQASKVYIDFISCLTNLFKDIVMAVQENDALLRSLCGEDAIVYAICELQEESDSRGTLIVRKYIEYRKLSNLTSEINSYKNNLLSEGPDPRSIEFYLEEILSLMQLGEDYTTFMLSKINGLVIDPQISAGAAKAFKSGSLNRAVQDITGYYVILEEFFMVENVRKAIKIDESVPDSLTTSMVDDVFFVLQSCCKRAISTSNINSVIAVLTAAVSLLNNEYKEALQGKVREQNVGAKVFSGDAGLQKAGREIAIALNNIDVSTDYVLKLGHEIGRQCTEVFSAPAERERIKSCVSELGEMSVGLKEILNYGLKDLVSTVTPRIRPLLDNIAGISYDLSESEYAYNEVEDPWASRLLHAVEANSTWLRPLMTTNNYDSFIDMIIEFVAKRVEVIMMQKRFSQLGGLQLDRDARALVSHFSRVTERTVREKFARITQMATILNLEKVSEIMDFWGENSGPLTWRLTPAEIRRVLGLRVDFRPDAIAALKL